MADFLQREGRPVLLDLFSGAGGCTKGYQDAGFYVIGVDKEPQPNYVGDQFIQADAVELLEALKTDGALFCGPGMTILTFDAIHASPPCQAFTKYRNVGNVGDYPNLIGPVRELLQAIGSPYVIENVEGAPLEEPVLICGSMFDPPMDIRRHRLFETNWPLDPPAWPCRHKLQGPSRFPGGRSKERTGTNRGLCRNTVEIGTWDIPLDVQRRAMGIDWMTLEELSEAIPPAFTRHVGTYLLAEVHRRTDEIAEAA